MLPPFCEFGKKFHMIHCLLLRYIFLSYSWSLFLQLLLIVFMWMILGRFHLRNNIKKSMNEEEEEIRSMIRFFSPF